MAAGPPADAGDGAPEAALGAEAARAIAGLMGRAASLKGVPRQGWIDKAGIARPESVADHSYGTALAAMAAGDCAGLDALRMVRMALLHDLAESCTGDIVPGAMPAGEKAGIERAAMDTILGALPEPLRGACRDAWSEFEEGRTAEAAMVRELDKIEMAGQAAAYAGIGRAEGLAEIAGSARSAVSSPAGRALLSEVSGRGGFNGAGRRGGPGPADGGSGQGADSEGTAEAQRTVIGILFEVVRRLQANADLDGEYMAIAASGRAEERRDRLAEIAAERSANSDAAARLLRQLEL